MCLRRRRAKFQRSSASETSTNLELNKWDVGNLMEIWPYLGNGERYA